MAEPGDACNENRIITIDALSRCRRDLLPNYGNELFKSASIDRSSNGYDLFQEI